MSPSRAAVATACGLVAGFGTWFGLHSTFADATADGHDETPAANSSAIPAADTSVLAAADSLTDEPFHVAPQLAPLFDAADREAVLDRLDTAEEPTFVVVTHTSRDDGYGGRLAPRLLRLAEAVGRDGQYLVVDQDRWTEGLHWEDGLVASMTTSLPDGTLGDGIVAALGELEARTHAESTVEPSVAVTFLILGALAGGAFYRLGLLAVGTVRVLFGYPFDIPRPNRKGTAQ